MKIAVLSGKGGTGKTLVSVNLAASAERSVYIDCDVEEPNGHLFFKPELADKEDIGIKIPAVDEKLCSGCRACVDFCKYNALAYISKKLIVFDEICHSCGGCVLFCPNKALTEREKIIGRIEQGVSNNVKVVTGILNTGEASGVPIIRRLIKGSENAPDPVFIDCPPGSACTVMESIRDADYFILVSEPTLFGVHNFGLVHELVKLFKKPYGAVLNKCMEGENPAEIYCRDHDIKILGRIPFDNELGRINSNAGIAARESEKFRSLFAALLETVLTEVPA